MEYNRRQRQIARQVKAAVLGAVQNLESDLQTALFERVDTTRAEIESDLGNRIKQIEDAVENMLVTKRMFEEMKTAMEKSLRTAINKYFKSIKRKSKKPEVFNDENSVPPAPPLKRTRSKVRVASAQNNVPSEHQTAMSQSHPLPRAAATTASMHPMPRPNSLPPPDVNAASMSRDFALCRSMSDPRTLRMTTRPSAERTWWIDGHMVPPQQTLVRREIIDTPRYLSPVFGPRNYAR